jgi:hypothetical protein
MTPDDLRDVMYRTRLRQVDVAWMCGVGERHARAWCLGTYAVPQYAQLLLRAFDEGKIDSAWLVTHIDAPPP